MAHFGLELMIPQNPIVVTNSDLQLFKRDRMEWFLSTALGLRFARPSYTGALKLGTRIHAALEQHYAYGRDLLDVYRDEADLEYDTIKTEDTPWFDEDEWRKEIRLGHVMLEGFLEWVQETGFGSDFTITAVEQKLSYPMQIDGTPIELRGKLDCRINHLASGMDSILDWKTTISIDKLTESVQSSEQILFYMLLDTLLHKDVPDHYLQGGLFVMLRKTLRTANASPPFYAAIEVHHSKTRLRNFYTTLYGSLIDYVRAVQALQSGADWRLFAYPSPGNSFMYSPYRRLIDVILYGEDAERMISDLYIQCDPHERYSSTDNSYAV